MSSSESKPPTTGGRPRNPGSHRAWHSRGYLPHFDSGAVVQMVTFRLADSLPRQLYESICARENEAEKRRHLEEIIDSGRGQCVLRDPEVADMVESALKHFDGERYRLISWVIMPNHVHVVIEQMDGWSLSDVVSSWKSFTAKKINKHRNTSGPVWARDYFDRFVRNRRHFGNAIAYVEGNPVKAGLVQRPVEWPFSSAIRNAGGTPAVPGML